MGEIIQEIQHINGVSYIGEPVSNTVMYVTKKAESLLTNLERADNCLVFCDTAIIVPDEIAKKHCITKSAHPQLDYVRYVEAFTKAREEPQKNRTYHVTKNGCYFGEHVIIGKNALIEPLCLIDHDVVIGENARIRTGCKIRNAIIGDDFTANENAVIGSSGFTMTHDEKGNLLRIPNLGKVVIGNHVEVGALADISAGTAQNTVIGDYVKIDACVHIAHDVKIASNVELTSGTMTGGFVTIENDVFVGINATLRNRIVIGAHSCIGMGSVVTKNVPSYSTVAGNPARPFMKQSN